MSVITGLTHGDKNTVHHSAVGADPKQTEHVVRELETYYGWTNIKVDGQFVKPVRRQVRRYEDDA